MISIDLIYGDISKRKGFISAYRLTFIYPVVLHATGNK